MGGQLGEAQGDGELTGDALETSMGIEFTVDVIPRKAAEMPRAEDDEFLMAMGIAGSLTEGLQIATTEMARWLEERHNLNPSEVASVLGTAMRYDIAEVVDPYVNVVARVPKKALARMYEKVGNFTNANALWTLVRKADPADEEAQRKVTVLAAN